MVSHESLLTFAPAMWCCNQGLNVPSSGFVAIQMLLPLCDRVTVYGFWSGGDVGKEDGDL